MASAQRYEIGAFLGGSNTISDVGSTFYALPNEPAFGGLFKWNLHPRMTLRVQVNKSRLRGDDLKSDIQAKQKRQFLFKSEITEFSLGAEINFFSFRIRNLLDKPFTPYVYMGAAAFWHDDLYFENLTSTPLEATDKKITMRLILAAEAGFRYTFTNNIDGSLPQGRSFSFGNKGTNDFYTFTGLTLTYTFGEEPCYCRK